MVNPSYTTASKLLSSDIEDGERIFAVPTGEAAIQEVVDLGGEVKVRATGLDLGLEETDVVVRELHVRDTREAVVDGGQVAGITTRGCSTTRISIVGSHDDISAGLTRSAR